MPLRLPFVLNDKIYMKPRTFDLFGSDVYQFPTLPVCAVRCRKLPQKVRESCRDSEKEGRNLQKTSVTDGFFWRFEVPLVTVIGPLLDLRPLSCKPLPLAAAETRANL